MNRFIEKRGECYALKSIAVQADIQEILRPYAGGIEVFGFLRELRQALQLANCIALTPDTDNEPLYQKLDRYTNEWVTIDQKEFDKLYYEEPRRVAPRTYGPTLRKFFKGGGKFQLTVDTRAEKTPEIKSKGREAQSGISAGGGPGGMAGSSGGGTMGSNGGGGRGVFAIHSPIIGEPVVPKKEFGVELTPKRKAQNVRSDKYLEVCGRGKRYRVADIKIDVVLDEHAKPGLEYCKPIDLGNSTAKILTKRDGLWYEWIPCKAEWQHYEPIKPEQLDPKACRQFVEQLLAFDELEAKREADIEQLLVTLLSHPEIGLLSYVHFVEGYKKC